MRSLLSFARSSSVVRRTDLTDSEGSTSESESQMLWTFETALVAGRQGLESKPVTLAIGWRGLEVRDAKSQQRLRYFPKEQVAAFVPKGSHFHLWVLPKQDARGVQQLVFESEEARSMSEACKRMRESTEGQDSHGSQGNAEVELTAIDTRPSTCDKRGSIAESWIAAGFVANVRAEPPASSVPAAACPAAEAAAGTATAPAASEAASHLRPRSSSLSMRSLLSFARSSSVVRRTDLTDSEGSTSESESQMLWTFETALVAGRQGLESKPVTLAIGWRGLEVRDAKSQQRLRYFPKEQVAAFVPKGSHFHLWVLPKQDARGVQQLVFESEELQNIDQACRRMLGPSVEPPTE